MMVEVRSSDTETDSSHKPVRVSKRALGKFWGLQKVMGQGEDGEVETMTSETPPPIQSLKPTPVGGN